MQYFCNLEKCFRCIITRCLRRDDALKALFFHYTPLGGATPLCGVVHFGENGAYVLLVSILFSSGENGTFLLCFVSVPPTPSAAARRRASVVLECRISLFTGNAAVRRCPFEKRLTQRRIPRTACAHSGASCPGRVSGTRTRFSPAGLRRVAAQPGGGGCRERKAGFMIKRACLGNNRQLYFHICKIYREGGNAA